MDGVGLFEGVADLQGGSEFVVRGGDEVVVHGVLGVRGGWVERVGVVRVAGGFEFELVAVVFREADFGGEDSGVLEDVVVLEERALDQPVVPAPDKVEILIRQR